MDVLGHGWQGDEMERGDMRMTVRGVVGGKGVGGEDEEGRSEDDC